MRRRRGQRLRISLSRSTSCRSASCKLVCVNITLSAFVVQAHIQWVILQCEESSHAIKRVQVSVGRPYAVVVAAAEQPTLQKHSCMIVVTAVKIMPFFPLRYTAHYPFKLHSNSNSNNHRNTTCGTGCHTQNEKLASSFELNLYKFLTRNQIHGRIADWQNLSKRLR